MGLETGLPAAGLLVGAASIGGGVCDQDSGADQESPNRSLLDAVEVLAAAVGAPGAVCTGDRPESRTLLPTWLPALRAIVALGVLAGELFPQFEIQSSAGGGDDTFALSRDIAGLDGSVNTL
jgi:hypothetical protein